MKYNKFSIIILCVILVYLSSVALINIVVDPFYIFQTPFFKIQAQINDRYAKIEFLKKRKGGFNSYIMGSSRMFLTHPDVVEKYLSMAKFYNLATIFATMYEHLLHVKYFIKSGYPVKHLYIGLDMDITFTTKMHDDKDSLLKLHPDVSNKNPIDFYWSYLSIFRKGDTKRKLRVNYGKKAHWKYEIETDGALALEPETEGTRVFSEKEINIDIIRIKNEHLRENLEALRELVALCKQHDINLILFITPYNKLLMDHFVAEDYIRFLKDLSEIVGFWDFSGYNSVTTDNKNYIDFSHYNLSVSGLIAARIFNDRTMAVPRDFGVWVTKSNIDLHLERVRISFEKNNRLRNGV